MGTTNTSRWVVAVAMVGITACKGDIGDVPTSGSSALDCSSTVGAPAPLRRLTQRQFENSIHALFGPHIVVPSVVDEHVAAGHFSNEIGLLGVDVTAAEQMFFAAEDVASQAIGSLVSQSSCDASVEGADVCLASFFDDVGLRIHRRPVAEAEREVLGSLFAQELDAGAVYEEALEAVLTAMLTSPQFWYHHEASQVGATGGAVPLDDFQIASRLSFFLWDSMPDDALLAAAAAGSLSEREGIVEQARRMLTEPAAKAAVHRFYREWLIVSELRGATRDPNLYPDFDPGVLAAMDEQVTRFVDEVYAGPRTLDALFTSTNMPVNGTLAPVLGAATSDDAQGWSLMSVDPDERMGILTLPALMTAFAAPNRSSIVRRGVFFYEHVLCGDPAPAPNNIAPLEATKAGDTQREKLAAHRANPACASCHDIFDPLGFGFEHYDALGKYRTIDESGAAVDSNLVLETPSELAGSYADVLPVLAKLPESATVQACFAEQWLRFAKGRFERATDQCDLEHVTTRFVDGALDLEELVVAIVDSDGFRFRTPSPGESP